MSLKLKLKWMVWFALVLTVAAGTAARNLSITTTTAELTLTPNANVDVSVFRPLPGPPRFYLKFERERNIPRPELGSAGRSDPRKTGFIDYGNPGVPIKLQVTVDGRETKYILEATSMIMASETNIWRDLLPFLAEGDLHHYPWPPAPKSLLVTPMGTSKLHVSVIEVGAPLLGERVSLVVPSPIGIKYTEPAYRGLGFFFFWPIYAVVLFIYGLVLLSRTVDHPPKAAR
jgi:hypothetical protein